MPPRSRAALLPLLLLAASIPPQTLAFSLHPSAPLRRSPASSLRPSSLPHPPPRAPLGLRMSRGVGGGDEPTKGSEEDLKQVLSEKNQALTPEEELAGEVTGGTRYVQASEVRRKEMKKAGTSYAELSKQQLSYPRLLIDRLVDAFDGAPVASFKPPQTKRRVVILGTGWGAHALVKAIDAQAYDVTVISPRNYFVFTPMLAGAATGTVELRSITESIRDANPKVNYLEATALEIKNTDKTVLCQSVVCDGASCSINEFEQEFDELVVTVGASVNTFGIEGVKEYCYFLKQAPDAAALREAIGNCFERANYPDMTDEERRRTLSFVVVGAGPTGVEFTGELRDFIERDVARFYPELLPFISIKLLEASDKVLMMFESTLQARAIEDLTTPRPTKPQGLADDYVQVLLSSAVNKVAESEMTLNDGTVIPYGVGVWAGGIGPMPLVLDLVGRVDEQQKIPEARGRLTVDRWLRVAGAPGVFALGDCSFLADTPLPATAQVASQQGYYLGRLFNKGYDFSEDVPVQESGSSGDVAKPFQFLNLGVLAYTGQGKALAQIEAGKSKFEQTGTIGWLAWRAVYLSKQVSGRNQLMVLFDWIKTYFFGRDLTRF